MADRTKIEWADSTFNPWIGCTKISPACDHCYAERTDARGIFGDKHWGPGVPRMRTSAANWRGPVKWNAKQFAQCDACGWRGESPFPGLGDACPECDEDLIPARRRVFCASLADVFDNEVPVEWRADLFEIIAATPHLDWLLLSKRIGNAHRMIDLTMDAIDRRQARSTAKVVRGPWPWPNVWLGATVCDQVEADRDIPKLLALPAAKRFLSIEPMLWGRWTLRWTRWYAAHALGAQIILLIQTLAPLSTAGAVNGPASPTNGQSTGSSAAARAARRRGRCTPTGCARCAISASALACRSC